jgi:hypothetical protein
MKIWYALCSGMKWILFYFYFTRELNQNNKNHVPFRTTLCSPHFINKFQFHDIFSLLYENGLSVSFFPKLSLSNTNFKVISHYVSVCNMKQLNPLQFFYGCKPSQLQKHSKMSVHYLFTFVFWVIGLY